jgi:superkiller protein 3
MLSTLSRNWGYVVVFLLVCIAIVLVVIRTTDKTDSPEYEALKAPPVPQALLEFDIKEKTYLDLLRKNPDDSEVLAALGDLYFENSRYEKAIDAYERTLKVNPEDADSYNDLGLAFHYTQKSDRAVETLRKGTEVDPSFPRVWLSLGFVLLANGRTEEAKEPLKKAADLEPRSEVGVEAQRLLGLIEKPPF